MVSNKAPKNMLGNLTFPKNWQTHPATGHLILGYFSSVILLVVLIQTSVSYGKI